MNNIISNIKEQIREKVRQALENAVKKGIFPEFDMLEDIEIEIPREKEHGDFSTNVAMQLARPLKKAPRIIATEIISNFDANGTYVDKVECAGPGFINFTLKCKWLYDALRLIDKKAEDYGKIDIGNGKKVMVEFVSANPTGPLHMGNARGGALGDLIASVLSAAGYDVYKEYYVNDAGNQMEIFGRSLEARFIQEVKGENAIQFPEDGYHGEDIIENVKNYISEFGDSLIDEDSGTRRKKLSQYALRRNLASIKSVLEKYGIYFDNWFSEQSLYDSGEIERTLNHLKENGYTIEKEGAIWLSADKLGIEKDEVLVKNNGLCTYFAADIAYHKNKFIDRGFDRVINLWGADHHGHVDRMKTAMKAFGVDPDRLHIVLFQLVRLYRNGEIARMSKRTGKTISLDDLLEEVGRDAARFFFNTKASGSHLDFDLDLAVQQSNENPVFYIQYAHARICSLLAMLEKEGYQVPDAEEVNLELLDKKEELDLIAKLAELPEEIRIAATTLEPSRLTRYVLDVAGLFHSFYNACRVKGEEENLLKARLVLVSATKTVIKNVLNLLSISAPERM